MRLRRAVFLAALAVPIAAAPAAAQFQPPPAEQMPPCIKEFVRLRTDTETKGNAIRAAQGKVNAQGACKLFNAYSAAEGKMLDYAAANNVWCGIPPEAIDQIKKAHVRTNEIRTRVCQAAAAGPARPAGPSLSDALGGPVPDSSNIKTGRGTFDTLTGSSPLGK
jgi:hypothetical protein